MRAHVSGLTIVAVGWLSLVLSVSPVLAQDGYGAPHPKRHHRSHVYTSNSGGWGSTYQSHGADCPNGDCRGLNSPGNMGGAHEF